MITIEKIISKQKKRAFAFRSRALYWKGVSKREYEHSMEKYHFAKDVIEDLKRVQANYDFKRRSTLPSNS